MIRLADYKHRFPNIAFERTDSGVLTMRLHRDGGPMKWTTVEGGAHDQIAGSLYYVARDPENHVVIFTGTGDSFIADRVVEEYAPIDPANWYRLMKEGQDMITGFLELDRPVITIANGPATFHPELGVLGDVVLAADDAYFQDSHIRRGLVPGDGCHSIWMDLLGTNRGRYFLMTAQTLSAQELLVLGAVAEVLPRDRLLPRALEIADAWLTCTPEVLRYSHAALNLHLRRRVHDELGHAIAMEGLGVFADAAIGKDPMQSVTTAG